MHILGDLSVSLLFWSKSLRRYRHVSHISVIIQRISQNLSPRDLLSCSLSLTVPHALPFHSPPINAPARSTPSRTSTVQTPPPTTAPPATASASLSPSGSNFPPAPRRLRGPFLHRRVVGCGFGDRRVRTAGASASVWGRGKG